MAKLLDGKALSKIIECELKERIAKVKEKLGFAPKLATILVGENPASKTYVRMKVKACERVGLGSVEFKLDENSTTEDVLAVINKLNKNKKVCGILLQHPVPRQVDEVRCFNAIALDKDVDGVNQTSFGSVTCSKKGFACATALGMIKILEHYKIEVEGKHAVVVGRSNIVGKPMAMLLLNKNATVTICHSKTIGLEKILKKADIVVGAVGKPKFIKAEWLKKGVVLLDAGYNEGNVGDIDMENAKLKAKAYTPVPGGVGPMTIASLMTQTVISAERLAEENCKVC